MLDFSSAAKVWPTKPTKLSANQSVSRGVSACIWWVNAGYIQMMLDCFVSSWARFKLSCVFVFFVFLLEPAATKAMTSLRMRELHFFLTQSSCQSERRLIHVIILSCLTRSSAKKKKKYCKKTKTFFVKHLLFSHYSSARTSKLLLSLLSFFRTFQHIVHNAGNVSHYELM